MGRHFCILWHFMAFYGILWRFGIIAKKSNRKSNPIFPILSDFFRFLDFSRLPDFPIPQLYKRPFSHSSSPSPSNLPPLPQRIRKDIQIEESEVESPEKETLRSAPILGNSPTPVSPL